jgi:hypothetical protein
MNRLRGPIRQDGSGKDVRPSAPRRRMEHFLAAAVGPAQSCGTPPPFSPPYFTTFSDMNTFLSAPAPGPGLRTAAGAALVLLGACGTAVGNPERSRGSSAGHRGGSAAGRVGPGTTCAPGLSAARERNLGRAPWLANSLHRSAMFASGPARWRRAAESFRLRRPVTALSVCGCARLLRLSSWCAIVCSSADLTCPGPAPHLLATHHPSCPIR